MGGRYERRKVKDLTGSRKDGKSKTSLTEEADLVRRRS